MIVTTRDPMTGRDVPNLASAPFVIEGRGDSAIKIFFESEQSRQAYIEVELDMESIDETLARAHGGTTHIAREM
jgi:hypothetical protein